MANGGVTNRKEEGQGKLGGGIGYGRRRQEEAQRHGYGEGEEQSVEIVAYPGRK